MKKLFSLFAAILFVGSMWATETPAVTLDFTDTGWGFPTDAYVTTEQSYTNGGNTITIGANDAGHKALLVNSSDPSQGIKSLIVGKMDATLTFPAMSFNVSKIVIKGEGGASGKVTFNIFVGDDAVSTEATSSKVNHEFPIAAAKQAAGTVYVFKVTNANNSQITSVEFYEAETCNTEVAITKGTETNGTFTLSATSVCADGDGGEIEVSEIEAADGYRFKEITSVLTSDGTTASGTVNNSTKKVTGIKAATTITAVFEEIQPATVSFSTGTGNPTVDAITEESVGAGITLPAGPTPKCSTGGWSFAGWAEAAVASETSNAPTLLDAGSTYKPEASITLYAVYAKIDESSTTWNKVTTAPDNWSGTYVIVNPDGNYAMTSDFYSGTSGEFKGASVSISNNQITSTVSDKMIWTVAKNGNNAQYSFKNKATGTYAKITGTSSTNAALDANAVWFTIASTGTSAVWDIVSVTNNARCFAYYDANHSFRTYAKSNYNTGYLYKETISTSYWSAPTCVPSDIEETVDSSVKSVKFIQNGQLFIEKNGHIYNAMGQMVK